MKNERIDRSYQRLTKVIYMLRFLPPMQQRRVSSKQHIEAMLKMSILAIFGLLLIGNGKFLDIFMKKLC